MPMTFTEGSGLQDSFYGKCQAPIRMFLEERGEAYEQESVLPKVFDMEKSKNFGEMFTTMTAMNGFQPVGENGTYPEDTMQEGYSKLLEHMTWKDKFSVSREIADDTKHNMFKLKQGPAKFIKGFYSTREMFGAAMFGGAMSGKTAVTFRGKTFDAKAADAKCLFDKNHPAKVSGKAQSNQFSDAFSNDALAAVESAMQNFRGDNNEILDVAPDTIVIPNQYALKKAVFAAIGADKDPATANNGFNFNFGRWNVVVWPYLNQFLADGATPWLLIDSKYNEEYGGAVWLDRTDLEVRSVLSESNDANTWHGYARFIAGFNDWRFAAVGGVTGGTKLISA